MELNSIEDVSALNEYQKLNRLNVSRTNYVGLASSLHFSAR